MVFVSCCMIHGTPQVRGGRGAAADVRVVDQGGEGRAARDEACLLATSSA